MSETLHPERLACADRGVGTGRYDPMSEPEQDPTSAAPPEGSHESDGRTISTADRSSTPKWIAALVVTTVFAAGAGWLLADRSTTKDLGEPVASEDSTDDVSVVDAA